MNETCGISSVSGTFILIHNPLIPPLPRPTMDRQRLQWLDAMRGFTMLLVVAYHVAQFAFGLNLKNSTSFPFLVLFRMPLFFFVSGFLSYRPSFQWTADNVRGLLWKKLLVQVIPALVFLSIYIVFRLKGTFGSEFVHLMSLSTKGGYWFTFVLLQMYVVFYILLFPLPDGKWRRWAVAVLWVCSLFVYETLYMPKTFSYFKDPFFRYTSIVETIRFFHFFLFGCLVRCYWSRFQRLLDTSWFFPLLALLAVICCADIFRWHTLKFVWTNLPRTLAMYSLVLMVVQFFRHYSQWFSSQFALGRVMQYVGCRTLDIYLLHFIVMPSLSGVGKWLNTHQPNFLLEQLSTISVAIPVVGFCCLISHFLRTSPFLECYLFGVRRKKGNQ